MKFQWIDPIVLMPPRLAIEPVPAVSPPSGAEVFLECKTDRSAKMHHHTTIGLMALAAVAAMAFIGASTATAMALNFSQRRKKTLHVVTDLELTGREAMRLASSVKKAVGFLLALTARNLALRPSKLIKGEMNVAHPTALDPADSSLELSNGSKVPQLTSETNDQHRIANGNEHRLILSLA